MAGLCIDAVVVGSLRSRFVVSHGPVLLHRTARPVVGDDREALVRPGPGLIVALLDPTLLALVLGAGPLGMVPFEVRKRICVGTPGAASTLEINLPGSSAVGVWRRGPSCIRLAPRGSRRARCGSPHTRAHSCTSGTGNSRRASHNQPRGGPAASRGRPSSRSLRIPARKLRSALGTSPSLGRRLGPHPHRSPEGWWVGLESSERRGRTRSGARDKGQE